MDDKFLEEIDNLYEILPQKLDLLEDNVLICECRCISVSEIRERISTNELQADILREKLGMGTGCGSCLKSLPAWKNRVFSN